MPDKPPESTTDRIPEIPAESIRLPNFGLGILLGVIGIGLAVIVLILGLAHG